MIKVLIVDDESLSRTILKKIVSDAGYMVTVAGNGEEALKKLNASKFDIMLTDLNMPVMNGIELTQKALKIEPDMIVILITAYGSIRTAVEAIKLGAYDFLPKPVNKDELLLIINHAIEKVSLMKENILLNRELTKMKNVPYVVSENEKMKNVLDKAKQIAISDSAVLITGEDGTEKHELAKFVHYNSKRRENQFITIDCNTLDEDIIESELFGNIKGFSKRLNAPRRGYLEIAEQGTVYINEISRLNLKVQSKLLRILNEQQFSKLGESKTHVTNVRVIASSSESLKNYVSEKKFNEELYKKLNLFEIEIQPLRERPEDILYFFNKFLEEFSVRKNMHIKDINPDVTRMIINYLWPGNLTELRNVTERVVILCSNGVLTKNLFPENIIEVDQYRDLFTNSSYKTNKAKAVREFEVNFIKKYLKLCKGNISEVARVIGFHQISLRQKIYKLGINPKEYAVKIKTNDKKNIKRK